MSEEKKKDRIEVTNKNALILSTGLLDTLVQQNKVIIQKLSEMYGVLSKIPATDIGGSDGKRDNGKPVELPFQPFS